MGILDLLIVVLTVIPIGLLIHLVMDANGVFDQRRKQREQEEKEN